VVTKKDMKDATQTFKLNFAKSKLAGVEASMSTIPAKTKISYFGIGADVLEKAVHKPSFGGWSYHGTTLPVIAIGPKGGKIVGYNSKGQPIYAGSAEAKKLAEIKKKHAELPLPTTVLEQAKIVEWLDALGIKASKTISGVVVSASDAKKITEAFGVHPSSKAGGLSQIFPLTVLKPHLGHALKPHEDALLDLQAAEASGTAEDPWPHPESLQEVPAGQYAGTHGNRLFKDSAGKLFLFKGKNAVIARAEEAASRLGELILGKGRVQKARVVKLEGKVGALIPIEEISPLSKAGGKVSASKLQKFGADIAQHYAFDWLIGQHDTHGENLAVRKDGKGLYGLDKGQAFKLIGDDKLDPKYKPNEHKQVYADLWDNKNVLNALDLPTVLSPVFSKAAAISEDQLRSIVAPYIDEYAKKYGLSEAKDLETKILDRFAKAKSNWEWFIGKDIPVSAEAVVTPVPKPGKKAPVPKPEMAPVLAPAGFSPIKKGTVTLLAPGAATKPGGWPGNYPGPGYVAEVKYKGEPYRLEFGFGDSGELEIEVSYPDGKKAFFHSPNAACDSLYLWKNGLDLQMSAADKKKKGISYSATKMLKLAEFGDALVEHASVVPPQKAPAPEVKELSVSQMLKDHGSGMLSDFSILPPHIQEFVKTKKSQVYLDVQPTGTDVWFSGLTPSGDPEYLAFPVTDKNPIVAELQSWGSEVPPWLKGTALEIKANPKLAPQPKAEPIQKTPVKVSTPKSAPAAFSGPLAPGTKIKVQKKFPGFKTKQDVELEVLENGKFMVSLPTGVHPDGQLGPQKEVFDSLSSASDWVWVNQKGHKDVEAYKAATGKKKIASGGGWKFWGVQPSAPKVIQKTPVSSKSNTYKNAVSALNELPVGSTIQGSTGVISKNPDGSWGGGKSDLVYAMLAYKNGVIPKTPVSVPKVPVKGLEGSLEADPLIESLLETSKVGTKISFTEDGEKITATKVAPGKWAALYPDGMPFEASDTSIAKTADDKSLDFHSSETKTSGSNNFITMAEAIVSGGYVAPTEVKTTNLFDAPTGTKLSWIVDSGDDVTKYKAEKGHNGWMVTGGPMPGSLLASIASADPNVGVKIAPPSTQPQDNFETMPASSATTQQANDLAIGSVWKFSTETADWTAKKTGPDAWSVQFSMTTGDTVPPFNLDTQNLVGTTQQGVGELKIQKDVETSLSASPSGQWLNTPKPTVDGKWFDALPAGSEVSIAHISPQQPAIDAIKENDGSWTMSLKGVSYPQVTGSGLNQIVQAQGQGDVAYKDPTKVSVAPPASAVVTKQPEDMQPEEAFKTVSADVSLGDAWKHIPEVKDHPELELVESGKVGHYNVLIKKANSKQTQDEDMALIQKVLDTYGLKPAFSGHPKASHWTVFATVAQSQFDKHVTVQMLAQDVPPLDVKNNFETMPEVETSGPSGKAKKLPKKIFKSWSLKKKHTALEDMPAGTKLTLGNGMVVVKTEQISGLPWEYEGATGAYSTFSIAQKVGFSGGAAVTAPGKTPKVAPPPAPQLKAAPPKYTPAPADPDLELKKAWAKAHPSITSEAAKHLAWMAKDAGIPPVMEFYARMAGDGTVLFGDGGEDIGKTLVAFGLPAIPVQTPFGTLYQISLDKLKEKTPGATTIKGPDGVQYPHGTTFETIKTFDSVETLLQGEANFQKFSDAKPGTGHSKAAKFSTGTDVQTLQKKYALAGPTKHGSSYNMILLTAAELKKDAGPEKLEVEAKVPTQPPAVKLKPMGFSMGVPGEGLPASSNRDELALAKELIPFRHGYSIRFGEGGILMDGQLRLHKVKLPDGKIVMRFVGELTKDAPHLYGNKKFAFLSSTTKPEKNIPGKKANDYDPETGIHTLTNQSLWSGGSSGAELTQNAAVYTFDNDIETLRRTFVVDVPIDADPEQALSEAMGKLGVDVTAAMTHPDDQDERILIKTQLLRSAIGPTGFQKIVNLGLQTKTKDEREKILDDNLKGKMAKKDIESAKVVIGAEGRHEVEADDLDLSQVKALMTGISASGIARALIQKSYGGQAQTLWTGNSKNLSSTTSGSSDMHSGGGFGKYFTMLNQNVSSAVAVGSGKPKLLLHPRVLKRTNWYAHNGDNYGSQKNAGKTRKTALSMTASSNEVLFETLSIRDFAGAVVSNQSQKDEILKALKAEGFEDINGIPLDAFVVVGSVGSPPVSKIKGLQPGVLP
jgi:hypothetical protein